MILYSLRKHLNPHTREIIKGDGMKANLAWTGLFSVCCTTVFKSEFAWKICKHKIKIQTSHVTCNGLHKTFGRFVILSWLIIIFYLEGSQSYITQNQPTLPLYSDSLKLHLMKPRKVRADSLRSQSVTISLV